LPSNAPILPLSLAERAASESASAAAINIPEQAPQNVVSTAKPDKKRRGWRRNRS
jgi:hypothetical protein